MPIDYIRLMNKNIHLAVALALCGASIAPNAFAQGSPPPSKPAGDISAAAKKCLASLDDSQRGKLVFDFKDEAQRKRWSNLPTSFVKRGGLRMGDLANPQREAVLAVLAVA